MTEDKGTPEAPVRTCLRTRQHFTARRSIGRRTWAMRARRLGFLIVCPFDLFPHGSRSSLFEPWDPSSKREDWGRRCRTRHGYGLGFPGKAQVQWYEWNRLPCARAGATRSIEWMGRRSEERWLLIELSSSHLLKKTCVRCRGQSLRAFSSRSKR